MKFEIRTARRGVLRRRQTYFRITSGSDVLAHSEGYNNVHDVNVVIASIKVNAHGAEVVDLR